ncbi:MAG: response regulator [Acholeplasmataceae bacterium]|jgi:signal transduction histidine kinase/CheY-like chemotaxis protein|nr:response regulator [Acholeplasmataceae bacterium]
MTTKTDHGSSSIPKSGKNKKIGYWSYTKATDMWTLSDDLLTFFKFEKISDFNTERMLDFIHPDDRELVNSMWRYSLANEVSYQLIHRMVIDQEVRWIRIQSRIDRDHMTFVGYLGTIEDVTKTIVKELESLSKIEILKSNIRELTDELESLHLSSQQKINQKSDYLSTMSHEIRTPMHALLGFVNLLEETQLDATQKTYLNRIKNASSHLLTIINDILDLSKIEAGKMTLDSNHFHIHQLVDDMKTLFDDQAKQKHLYFEIETIDCPFTLVGDFIRIKQMLINLISNAIKFTDTGGISLLISCQKIDAYHINLILKVQDTGIGMSSSQQQRLFSQYEQASSSTTRLYGGTGLGLSITKRLIELMKGTLKVESKLSEGSIFTLMIPLEIYEEDDEVVLIEPLNIPKSGSKILVADDHMLSQKLMEHMLTHIGIHVVIADDGEQALKMARDQSFDLIFLDIHMPKLDGIKTAQLIRMFQTKVPILGLSASSSPEEKVSCLLAGMNDVLSKPLDQKTLYQALIQWIPQE